MHTGTIQQPHAHRHTHAHTHTHTHTHARTHTCMHTQPHVYTYHLTFLHHFSSTLKKNSSSYLLAFFDPLADILFCWFHSQVMPTFQSSMQCDNNPWVFQMLQRHLQSETQVFSQYIAPLLLAATKFTSRGSGRKNNPVLLSLCVEVILPLKMHTLVKTDQELVFLYSGQKASQAAKLTIDDLKIELIPLLETKVCTMSRGCFGAYDFDGIM